MLPAILVASVLLAFPLIYKTKLLSLNEFLVSLFLKFSLVWSELLMIYYEIVCQIKIL